LRAELIAGGVVEVGSATILTTERQLVVGGGTARADGRDQEDDAKEGAGVEFPAGQERELLEHCGKYFLRFVDDQDGPGEGGRDVVAPAGASLPWPQDDEAPEDG
jgi:hypothetical protein